MQALFLDDERFPPNDGREWAIVRTVPEAIAWVEANGCPAFISFDNDLGQDLEGHHFARWLCERDLDTGEMPDDFAYYPHSRNIVRARTISDLLDAHLAYRAIEREAGRPWPPEGSNDPWAALPTP